MTINSAVPFTPEQEKRSALFVRFIDILFAIVTGQSFVFLASSAGVSSWIANPSQNVVTFGDAILAYSLMVTSWIGYHASTTKLPMKNVGRFIIDIILLFFYYLAFVNVKSFGSTSIIIFAVFFLYFAWSSIRLYEYYDARATFGLVKRTAQAGTFAGAFFVIALIAYVYPDATIEGVLLFSSFALLIYYRKLYWGGPKNKQT